MNAISKVVRIGKIQLDPRHKVSVFCKIEYRDGRLSISGVEGPRNNGDAWGSCGQIDMRFNKYRDLDFELNPAWTPSMWLKFRRTWRKWRLHDMRPECEHQRALGWTYDAHPNEACPVCGYRIGSEWKRVEVPETVLSFLESLPETDIHPAWI